MSKLRQIPKTTMNTIKLAVVLIVIGIFTVSCEGPIYFNVTVVDKITQQPIDSVLVKVIVKVGDKEKSAYNLQGYTDTAGNFIRDEMIGYGLSLRQWDFYMEYEKEGYIKKTEINHTDGLVELEQ
ncbi:MAG: hypothetical protein KBB11_08015 [Bacteroidales bacterium]|nr:hypothetical protein [Bacteroidales bacterium]HQP04325.1 hypothetical protein [Bacteroidales bacterium]